jgi:ketosteroid isomerase-like protein
MPNKSEVETVLAWHTALNAGDVHGLLALSAEDVEVGGPRGSGSGAHLLQEWVARAGMRMQPGRLYRRDSSVVVEERAQWRSDDGQLGDPQSAACVFGVRDGRVIRLLRYPDIAAALAAAGLDESDAALESAGEAL